MRLYARGLALTDDSETRRIALSGLAEVAHPGIVEAAEPYAADPNLAPLVDKIRENASSLTKTPTAPAQSTR
jgi:hypothetical protein